MIKLGRQLWLILLISHSCITWCEIEELDCLFVFYDAGETKSFQPVLPYLVGINYKIITMGTSRSLIKGNRVVDLNFDLGFSPNIDGLSWDRSQEVEQKSINKIVKKYRSKLVITGSVSKIQAQIALAFRKQGSKVVSYYDSFIDLQAGHIANEFIDVSDIIWVPSKSVKESYQLLHPNSKVVIAGQPSIEKYRTKPKINRIGLLPNNKKNIVFIGGYGKNYAIVLKRFLKIAVSLPRLNFVISLHPKVDGKLEELIVSEVGGENIQIAPKTLSTRNLVSQSDLVVSQNSTVGIQALFSRKPSVFFTQVGSNYTNFAIKSGWIPKVDTDYMLLQKLYMALYRVESFESSFDNIDAVIPKNSTNIISQMINQVLAEQ